MGSLIDKVKDAITSEEPTHQDQSPVSNRDDFSRETVLSEVESIFEEGKLSDSDLDDRTQADIMNELESKAHWFETEFDPAADEMPSMHEYVGDDEIAYADRDQDLDEWIDDYLTEEFVTYLNETLDLTGTIIYTAFEIEGEPTERLEDFDDKVGDFPALHFMHNRASYVRVTVANHTNDD